MFEVKIPERWKKIRFSGLFIENKEKNINFAEDNALQFYFGTIIQKKKFELTEELIETYKKYTVVKPEDIVINGLNLNYDFVSQRVGVVTEKGIITSAYLVLRMREKINIAYYGYLLKALDSQKFFHGLGSGVRLTLSYNDLRNIFLPVPPLDEQEKIVRYLDKKTSDMTNFIDAKKKQVELLKELKRSIISDAVTNGIFGDKIPERWQELRNKDIFREKKDLVGENFANYKLLSLTKSGVIIRDTSEGKGKFPKDFFTYKKVSPDDMIFCLFDIEETPRTVGLSPYFGMITGAYDVFEVVKMNPRYVFYYYLAVDNVKALQPFYTGLRKVVKLSTFMSLKIPVPPLDEQKEIADYLDVECAKIENLIEAIQKEISLVEELRKSLISEVVTGKIDVRELI